jgi:molybdopterin biosynthesis enzyme
MVEFLKLALPDVALKRFLEAITSPLDSEEVDAMSATGRVNSRAIKAGIPLPPFPRSTVDGYAVRAIDTFVGESHTCLSEVLGMKMGNCQSLHYPATCGVIHTGVCSPKNRCCHHDRTHQSVKETEIIAVG